MRQASAPLPSRLIDVELDQNRPSVRLHVTESDAELGSYAALSCCWGGHQPFNASKRSIEKLKSGFAVSTLPQTIQDAIEVTRKIGLNFLWVDSLCIVQDCEKDKDTEIKKMGSIYKNATVTIAATVASSATEGFLRTKREPPETYPYDLSMEDGTTDKILLTTEYECSPFAPLDTRGWAFQERLLSPRLLQFTEIELTWTCQTEPFKTISGPKAYYSKNLDPRLPSQIFVYPGFTERSWTSRQQLIDLWRDVITTYSGRELTYADDRPLALLGIAAELQKIWPDEYVHGLWTGCMIPLLAWYTWERDQRSCRAPSWSWQSLNCDISFQIIDMEDAKVISINSASTESHKRISLDCKILDEEAMSKDSEIFKKWDTDMNEYSHEKNFCLWLGDHKKGSCTGLMIANVENALFRRVGFFQSKHETKEIWNTCQRQTIFLE